MQILKNKEITLRLEEWGKSKSGEISYAILDCDTSRIIEIYLLPKDECITEISSGVLKRISIYSFLQGNSDGELVVSDKSDDFDEMLVNCVISGNSWDLIDDPIGDFSDYVDNNSLNDEFVKEVKQLFEKAWKQS